ncbi:flavin reductase [Ignisphaera sp. 4213-co]|uniref:Flavin reductase n=1 Tax=Ignisphaera cupida TaxID=3050454 RepID=A0ABD4Z7F6_9CREN|nr:flavin reductase [Ignisphaera sp. 4213-co]MDK6028858.1 flavin reductase [Ignisphaera sp. 4213-co]
MTSLECKVVGKHLCDDRELFVGEVVAYHYREDAFKDGEPNLEAGFLAHIAFNRFVTFSKSIIHV